jgi:hypothetical protein
VLVQHCDVAEEAAVEHAFAETVKTLGRVDACRAQCPLKTGSRFSTNARAASL